jgi:hypothetical protein
MEKQKFLSKQIEVLKRSNPRMLNHPERQKGEMFLGNQNINDKSQPLPYSYQTLRIGKIAYDTEGKVVKRLRPLFVSIREYLEHHPQKTESAAPKEDRIS